MLLFLSIIGRSASILWPMGNSQTRGIWASQGYGAEGGLILFPPRWVTSCISYVYGGLLASMAEMAFTV